MRNRPTLSPRYWSALCLASIFGCNTGDMLAEDAGLGHWRGLPILALAFGLALLGERRAQRPGETWYWLAIVIVRTAATNLADLIVHDAQIPYPIAFAGCAAILIVVMAAAARRGVPDEMPKADGVFWTGMFAAGIFGTAGGDYLAFERGLGLDVASLATSIGGVVMLWVRAVPALRVGATFWVAVVMIRTAGTNLGDLFAREMTLDVSTVLTGAALGGLLMLWPSRTAAVQASGVLPSDAARTGP